MTIKRRLFLSNILMLVTPIFLTMLMFSCVIFILMGITGVKDMRSFVRDDVYYIAVPREDFHEIRENYEDYDIIVTVYDGETLIYESSAGTNPVTKLKDTFGEDFYIRIGIFAFVLAISIVLIVNRILTRFISRRITTPIEVLVSGVHEIRDGNLDYRIQHDYDDEFKPVCTDFNDMAQHLSDMVSARQKDETNRRELIAGISHDLRTPLTSIKAYIEGIEKGVASTPEKQQKYLDIIKNKTSDLEYIIGQLFLFSKLDIGEFPFHLERVNIAEELRNTASAFADEYNGCGLTVVLAPNGKNLYADIDIVQFRCVLRNILDNSIKYKAGDSVISKIDFHEYDNNIVISITDNGSGVPEENLENLFNVFYRSDASRKDPGSGNGLGLAITKKIIERFGGTIHAENAEEGGLAIIITLPEMRDSI